MGEKRHDASMGRKTSDGSRPAAFLPSLVFMMVAPCLGKKAQEIKVKG
jgi:hypothetical protein